MNMEDDFPGLQGCVLRFHDYVPAVNLHGGSVSPISQRSQLEGKKKPSLPKVWGHYRDFETIGLGGEHYQH